MSLFSYHFSFGGKKEEDQKLQNEKSNSTFLLHKAQHGIGWYIGKYRN